MTAWRSVRLASGLVLAATACGGQASPGAEGGTARPRDVVAGTLTVFAAASLTESFEEIGRQFEAANPGARLTFNFGASSVLANQVRAGAPADVIAAAEEPGVRDLARDGLLTAPVLFARNRLAILVEKGNPEGIRSLTDLARPGLTVVLCAEEVPCGKLARTALAKAGATARPRSLEANVKAVVSKVVLGEADAGLVYVTDVRTAAGEADGVAIPPEHNVATSYPIARSTRSANSRLADMFIRHVRSAQAREVLARAGFDVP